jgi:hypothetical protein
MIPLTELFKEGEISKSPVVAEKVESYRKKRPDKKEFLGLPKELPDHIVEHYLILLRLEREV